MDDSVEHPAKEDRLTGEAAFNKVKKEVAERNDEAHKAARKLRDASEQRKVAAKRHRELHEV